MSANQLRTLGLAFFTLSFLWLLVFPWVGAKLEEGTGPFPVVPYVSRPVDGFLDARDFGSSVPSFVIALLGGLVASAIAEIGKILISGLSGSRSILLVGAAFQTAAVVETVRANVPDWWLWLLSLVGMYTPSNRGDIPIGPYPIPYFAAGLLLILVAMNWRQTREGR